LGFAAFLAFFFGAGFFFATTRFLPARFLGALVAAAFLGARFFVAPSPALLLGEALVVVAVALGSSRRVVVRNNRV
jgi:hypothetical protein